MRIFTLLLLTFMALSSFAAEPAVAGKTGVYEAVFPKRSPLTLPKELTLRLGDKKLEGEYDPAKEECFVCIPDSYDPAKPMGLVVLLNYKGSGEPPKPALPVFAERNLALVIPKNNGQPPWAKCALAVDIAQAMPQLYKMDPQRV